METCETCKYSLATCYKTVGTCYRSDKWEPKRLNVIPVLDACPQVSCAEYNRKELGCNATYSCVFQNQTEPDKKYEVCATYQSNSSGCSGITNDTMCPACPKYKPHSAPAAVITKGLNTGEWEIYGDGEVTTDGLKYDESKVDLTYLKDWSLALAEICKLSEFGAEKYSRGGWTEIKDPERLNKALLRHYFNDNGKPDADSGFLHDVARAWNALGALQIRLQNENQEKSPCEDS